MKKVLLLLTILMFILSSFQVLANDQGNLPNNYREVLGYSSDVSKPFSVVVAGGMCSDNVDDAGCVRPLPYSDTCNNYNLINNFGGRVSCEGEGINGCRVCFYDAQGKPKQWTIGFDAGGCISLYNKGSVQAPATAYTFEKYECKEDRCMNYDPWQNVGCGVGICNNDPLRMLRRYTDACENTHEECIPWTSCRDRSCYEHYENVGSCVAGVQRQVLIRTDCQEGLTREISCSSAGTDDETTPTVIPSPVIVPTPVPQTGIVLVASEESKEVTDALLITSSVKMKNTGSSMETPYILEMQVRPKGQLPLSIVGLQETCDPNHPENPHRNFKLGSGEEKVLQLTTGKKMDPGWYTIYLLTRTKCYNELNSVELANLDQYWRVNPYPNTLNLGDICVGDACYSTEGQEKFSIGTILFYGLGALIALFIVLNIVKSRKKR